MSVPKPIEALIERFEANAEAYRSGAYNETQIRQEFIDPFFEVLGWDVRNKSGYAEAYKDVIHGDSIRVEGHTRAPDYCFRIGGTRKFFLEAKKPSISIKDAVHPAYQLRRYAWSAKLSLSILTDFEEFAVCDCRNKPAPDDSPAIGRVMYLTFTDYARKWEEIESVFSREAVLKGSFDAFVETRKGKRGTAEVDDAFLREIESWRETLARTVAIRNPALTTQELNFTVQRTIDRIIFLRICEDRGIEHYGRLMSLLNGANVYKRMVEVFYQADERYNSGLFHFQKEKGRSESPDGLTLGLDIDDKPLKEIIQSLYYPQSPYEFSVLPADILGQVYEQFLGKVIRLTAGHRAVVEDKPEVKKAGGVYYTPTYIVEYIVKNTVGKLLSPPVSGGETAKPRGGLTPKRAESLKVLDPACGSGSFLIGAYQYLLDWHRDWYVNDGPGKWAMGREPKLYQAHGGGWKLTTSERKRILLNHIYGVDIDSQAVEVTKLSLLLKVLEGETENTISSQLKLFHERALPDLSSNIKCGNSLIGPDFYEHSQMDLLDDAGRRRINIFDWEAEFPEVFKPSLFQREGSGGIGFDAVIGNPPYGYMISEKEQDYFLHKYKHQDYQKDLYLLFLERYGMMLKTNGLLGIIVTNTWLQSVTYKNIRSYLTNQYCWLTILHLPEKVFKAVVDTHVLIFERRPGFIPKNEKVRVEIKGKNGTHLLHQISLIEIPRNGDCINIITSPECQNLYRKILELSRPLSDYCDVYNGIKPFEKGKGNPPQTDKTMTEKPFVKEGKRPGKQWSPLLRGSLINRYQNLWNNNYWILYGEWLAAPREKSIFEAAEKIMVRQTGDSIIATKIEGTFFARNNLHIVLLKKSNLDTRFILSILNSKVLDFCYSIMNPEKGEALAEVKKQHVEQLPVRSIDFSNPLDKSIHDKLVSLVTSIIDLNKKFLLARTEQEKTVLARNIEANDKQIDKLVYGLYGLTEEEIGIVELNQ